MRAIRRIYAGRKNEQIRTARSTARSFSGDLAGHQNRRRSWDVLLMAAKSQDWQNHWASRGLRSYWVGVDSFHVPSGDGVARDSGTIGRGGHLHLLLTAQVS